MAKHIACIHADLAPVQRYRDHLKRAFDKDLVVIELPPSARAHGMNKYRYTTCTPAELPELLEAGAKEITPCT